MVINRSIEKLWNFSKQYFFFDVSLLLLVSGELSSGESTEFPSNFLVLITLAHIVSYWQHHSKHSIVCMGLQYISLWTTESIVETASLGQMEGNLKCNNPHATDVN